MKKCRFSYWQDHNMQVHAPDQKKKNIIVVSTVIGVLLVTVVWGFQIHYLFTDGLAKEVDDTKTEASDTIKELEEFQAQVEQQMPMITTSFSDLTEAIKMQLAQDEVQQEAEQEIEKEAVNSVVEEALTRLEEQNLEENQEPIE